jgi:hypothetical protein
VVCLHHGDEARLSLVSMQGNRDQVAACHAVQPAVSDASNQASPLASLPEISLFRINRAWRAHSSPKPCARVSGAQICTGLSPLARSLSRRRCTRGAPVRIATNALHVAFSERDFQSLVRTGATSRDARGVALRLADVGMGPDAAYT